MRSSMLSCPYNHDQELLHSDAKDDQELLHSNTEDGICISQCLTSMYATTCVSVTPPLLANHVHVFCTPLIQTLNVRVLHPSVCCTHPPSYSTLIQTTNIRVLQTSVCRVHHWYKVRTSVCYTLRVSDTLLIQATSVCYRCPCVAYCTTDTRNPHPCVGLSCEPLIEATHVKVSRTRPIQATHIHAIFYFFFTAFVICAIFMHPSQCVRVI